MIDPVTAIGLATTAFNGIKKAIETGKEISDMGTQLGQWAQSQIRFGFCTPKGKKSPTI